MRTVSQTALTTLSQHYGVEPVNLLQIFWTPTNVIWYADKTTDADIRGKILELSAFDDTVNFDGSNSTQTFNVTLDDVDGSIKHIYDFNDIHKVRVKVYQWFAEIPLADAFLIFTGEINSPIVWKEGERTLTFSIVSQIEDQEVGFAPEEGLFDLIPDELLGKAWPLPFGTCLLIPALKTDPIPTGILLDTTAAVDPNIDKQISELGKKTTEFYGLATLAFYAAITAYNAGMNTAGSLHIDEYWQGVGDGYVDQGNQYLAQGWQAQQEITNLIRVKAEQKKYSRDTLRVHNGDCFPQGQPTSTTLANGTQVTGLMAGGIFQVDGVVHPAADADSFSNLTQVPVTESVQTGGTQSVIQKLGMVWEPVDQPFKFETPIPVSYIVAMLPCSVVNVWAYRNYNDARLLMQVPVEYYSVTYVPYGTITTTQIVLNKPLSYYDSKWDDSLYVDVISPVGPNTVSVLTWLIENYTNKGIDAASFAHVSAKVAGMPSNFCLLKQENIIRLLSDIAYQARCALLLKNDKFYLIFLPEEPAPVDTITEADILVNTLEIDHTPTENLITKLVADYVTTYAGGKSFKVIIRNNTLKYGIHEQSTDWFIYTNPKLVEVGASFWIIRKSNTWKILKFKTPLHKIRLETFDPVRITFANNWACTGPITGIVQSVKLNTSALNLEFEVWIPVRLGEMHKYNFAWPPNSTVNVAAGQIDFQKPGSNASGNLGSQNGATFCGPRYSASRGSRTKATHPTAAEPTGSDIAVALSPQPGGLDGTARPNIPYNFTQHSARPFVLENARQGVFPGQITNNDDAPNAYVVRTYFQGLPPKGTGSLTAVKDVTGGDKLPTGTWVAVIVVAWKKRDRTANQDVIFTERYMVPTASTASVFMGKVLDPNDDGYTVELYTAGIDNPATETVTARQIQIADDETIPSGTWTIVVKNMVFDEDQQQNVPEYTIQVPVYLGEEE